MRYGLYFSGALFLVILQTTLMPLVPLLQYCYDLILPLVVYLGLFRPFREGLPTVIVLGLVQDSMTGGVFGLYLTSYFWIFVGANWVITFLRVTNTLLILFVVAVAVMIQNLIFFGIVGLAGHHGQMPADAIQAMLVQVGWALATGPIFLTVLDRIQTAMERRLAERLSEKEV